MMPDSRWRVVHYEKENGRCPISEFLDSLNEKEQVEVLAAIDLLEEEGPRLRRPYADVLKDGIYELRVRISSLQYRVLYFFCNRTDIVLTHGFKKKARAVPEAEIRRAREYRKDWMVRSNEDS